MTFYPSCLNNDHPSAADIPAPSGIPQEPHVRRVVGKGLVVGGNPRCAQLRLEEEVRGARWTNSGQRSALGVVTRLYRGQEFKFSRSGPLDQEVKTKLILCPRHIARSKQVKSNEYSGTTTTTSAHYGSSRKHQKPSKYRASCAWENEGHLRAEGY